MKHVDLTKKICTNNTFTTHISHLTNALSRFSYYLQQVDYVFASLSISRKISQYAKICLVSNLACYAFGLTLSF